MVTLSAQRVRRLLGTSLVGLLLVTAVLDPALQGLGLAQSGPAPRVYLPLVTRGQVSPPLVPAPGADQIDVDVTDAGFEPPIALIAPGSLVTFRNRTAAPVTLTFAATAAAALPVSLRPRDLASGSVSLSPGQAEMRQIAKPTTITRPDRPDQQIELIVDPSVESRCTAPAPRPNPAAAPATLTSPPATACSGTIPTTAPPPPATRMPTTVGDISIAYEYLSSYEGISGTVLFTRTYEPAALDRADYGRFDENSLRPSPATACVDCQMLLQGRAWAIVQHAPPFPGSYSESGAPRLTFDSATPGASLHVTATASSIVARLWGTCTAGRPSAVRSAPFNSAIYDLGLARYGEEFRDGRPTGFRGIIGADPGTCGTVAGKDADGRTYTVDGAVRVVIGAIEVIGTPALTLPDTTPGDQYGSTHYGRGTSSDLRFRMTVDATDLGEFTSHVFRPRSRFQGSSTVTQYPRSPDLSVAADGRGGRFFVPTGEYLAPLSLFATSGAGIPAALSLQYSSLDSLLYRGAVRLPRIAPGRDLAKEYAPTPFGQGWSYTYGIRILDRDPPVPAGLDGVGVGTIEIIGPNGERTQLARARDFTPARPAWIPFGGLSWFADRARLERTASGYRLSSADVWDTYEFDAQGRLTEIRRLGYSEPLRVAYAGADQVVTDSGGKVVRFTFADDRVTRVADPLGGTWTFTYTDDSLTEITHQPGPDFPGGPSGYRWQFSYDPASYLLTTIREPDCRVTRVSYATGAEPGVATPGAFAGSTTAGAFPIAVTYPADGVVVIKDPDGGETTHRNLDSANGLPVPGTLRSPEITDPLGQKHVVQPGTYSKDPAGRVVQRTYDGSGVLTGIHRSQEGRTGAANSGAQEILVYEPPSGERHGVGNPRRLIEAAREPGPPGAGNIYAFYSYDEQDRLIQIANQADPDPAKRRPIKIEYDAIGRLAAVTDGEARVTRYAYAGLNNQPETMTREDPAASSESIETRFTYDGLGNVKTMTDGRGFVWSYDYDALGRLIKTTTPGSTTVSQGSASTPKGIEQAAYDPLGRLLTHRNARGFDTTYRYDALGRPEGVTNPDGGTAAWTYDGRGNLKQATSPLGGSTTYDRDALGRPRMVTGPDQQQARYGYDPSGNVTMIVSGADVTDLSYDPIGQVEAVEHPTRTVDGVPFRDTERFRYLGTGPLYTSTVQVRPGVEQGWSTRFDALWRPIESFSHDGPATRFQVSSFSTAVTYDRSGLPVSWTDPRYNAIGSLPDDIVPGGRVRTIRAGRDVFGRPTVMTETMGTPLAGWRYDKTGNVTDWLAPVPGGTGDLTVRQSARYDERGQLAGMTNVRGESSDRAYDANGNRLWSKDERDCTTEYAYDPLDRVTRVTQMVPPKRQIALDYRYDRGGNVTSRVGPYDLGPAGSGQVRAAEEPPGAAPRATYEYDKSGRVTKVIQPGGQVYQLTYDPATGRLDTVTLPTGQKLKYEYSGGRYLATVTDATTQETIESWEYDGQGRPIRAQRGDFAQAWTYDHNIPMPSSVSWIDASRGLNPPKAFVTTVKYDAASGQVARVTEPDQRTVTTYKYREDDQLASIERTSPTWSGTWSYAYYPGSSNLQGWTLPNGISTTVTYKDDGRIDAYTVKDKEGAPIAVWRYFYPKNAAVVSQTIWEGKKVVESLKKISRTNGLGVTHQLIRNELTRQEEYQVRSFRPNGDLESLSAGSPLQLARSYAYEDGTSRLAKVTRYENGETSPLSEQQYDARGNAWLNWVFQRGIRSGYVAQYDLTNRLTAVAFNGSANPFGDVTYAYLPTGALARRSEAGGRDETGRLRNGETRYWIDPGIGDLSEQTTATEAGFRPTARYARDPGGQKLARFDAQGAPEFYIEDPEGSLALTVDSGGAVHRLPTTNAYGQETGVGTPATGNEERFFRFGGQYRDPRTGLSLAESGRWYDPLRERFLQPAGDGAGASPYSFGGRSPTFSGWSTEPASNQDLFLRDLYAGEQGRLNPRRPSAWDQAERISLDGTVESVIDPGGGYGYGEYHEVHQMRLLALSSVYYGGRAMFAAADPTGLAADLAEWLATSEAERADPFYQHIKQGGDYVELAVGVTQLAVGLGRSAVSLAGRGIKAVRALRIARGRAAVLELLASEPGTIFFSPAGQNGGLRRLAANGSTARALEAKAVHDLMVTVGCRGEGNCLANSLAMKEAMSGNLGARALTDAKWAQFRRATWAGIGAEVSAGQRTATRVASLGEIERSLLAAGHGEQGLVYVRWNSPVTIPGVGTFDSHIFNAANRKGFVFFPDAQGVLFQTDAAILPNVRAIVFIR